MGETRRPIAVMFRGRLGQAREEVGVAVRAALAELECEVEGGEELESSLVSGVMAPYFAYALQCFVFREYTELDSPKVAAETLESQIMLPASKSRGTQCLFESSVVWLMYVMDFMELSACSCSTAVLNPSMQASQHTWSGREPSATASQMEKARIGGVTSPAEISRTNFSIGSH